MSDISERLVVHCPDHEAARRLATYISHHTAADGKTRIRLRLPIVSLAGRSGGITRNAIATLYPLRTLADPHPTYSVTWELEGGGVFPKFAGALAVERSVLDDCFGLIVCGHYEIPFGLAGAVFDATIGRRIARASARDLLRAIADEIEGDSATSRAGSEFASETAQLTG